VIAGLLRQHGLWADKSFGQNFLIDNSVLESILAAADITQADTVLEIGPGLGVLTRELAQRAAQVVAIELDQRLVGVLHETLADWPNITLLQGDALRYDFAALPQDALLVANLPYNVATPLLVSALESARFKRLVVMVQREVADRLSATAGKQAYGALSLVVAHFGKARKVRDVKPTAFLPPPSVMSSVVRIDVDAEARPHPELFALIHEGFRHRRKTLRKNLLMAGYDAAMVAASFDRLGLSPMVRAEALDLTTFKALWRLLND
jgi:16S rRNA (adenine1518-N6/adenine1519-N6)-dimethyltransferase